jgi:trans-2,3-dihydro-3-hydroxyanthranilate isomerase
VPVDLAYRILNVFTIPGERLSGNPLCVVEEAGGLDTARMQALARQFNLSETTFLLPPGRPGATAQVRIFTPGTEMPFAGHPTLGTAHVVRDLAGCGDEVLLSMPAGDVRVRASGDRWTLSPPRTATWRDPAVPPAELAAMLGLPPAALGHPLWVNSGVEQLLVPVRGVEDVRRASPDPARLARDARSPGGESMADVFAQVGDGEVEARGFFSEHGAALEDPATGSACANLGGWLIATGTGLPARRRVRQGVQAGRPSLLELEVDAERTIHVSGEVVELGRGTIRV